MAIIDTLSLRFEAEASKALKSINELEQSLKSLSGIIDTLGNKKINFGVTATTITNIRNLASALRELPLDQLKELSSITQEFKSLRIGIGEKTATSIVAFGNAVKTLDVNKLKELAAISFANLERLGVASSQIKGLSTEISRLKTARTELDKLNNELDKTTERAKRVNREVKKSGGIFASLGKKISGLFKSIGRIAFYRAIRSMIKAVTQGLGEGLKNLYYWSQAFGTSFYKRMDQMATATQYLKNGFASMFSPLIEKAIPILDALIDKFVDFFNFVQEGFAQLTGSPTWNKAKKVPATWQESLDDASKSAKELKNQLMGFDELNVLNTPSNSGRSGNGNEVDYSSMFELVETAAGNNFEGIGEKLANALNKVFDDPEAWGQKGESIANAIINGFGEALDFIKGVNWTNIGASISEFVSKFATKIAEYLKDEDPFGDAIDALTNALCGVIEGVNIEELIKSIAKLFVSLNAALPSVILASLSSTFKIIGTILNKLGLTGMGSAAMSVSDTLTEARKQYDEWKKLKLDYIFAQIDSLGNDSVPIDVTHNNGGTATPDAMSIYDQQGRTVDIVINFKTALNGVEEKLSDIKQDISDFFDDVKLFLSAPIVLIKFAFKKFSESEFGQDLKDWAKDFTDWWKDHPTPISWFFDLISDERMEELKEKIKTFFEENPAPIDWIMNKLGWGDKWKAFKDKIADWFKQYPAPIDWIMEKTGRGDKWKEFKQRIKDWFAQYPAPIDWMMDKTGRGDKWKEFKKSISDWFAKYPTPISWLLQKTNFKENWSEIKNWFEKHPFPILAAVESITEKVREAWNSFLNSDVFKNLKLALTVVAPALNQLIKDKISNWWTNEFLPWWENNTGVGRLVLKFKSPEFKAQLDNWWNNEVVPWFRDKFVNFNIKTPHFSWVGGDPNPLTWVNPANRPHIKVEWYAQGGFINPSSYSLAGLGENGIPEILGTVGGRSAVAGGAEITGIREAIYEQGQREENLLRTLISAVNSKDLQLVANSSTGRWVSRALNAYAGVTG